MSKVIKAVECVTTGEMAKGLGLSQLSVDLIKSFGIDPWVEVNTGAYWRIVDFPRIQIALAKYILSQSMDSLSG